MRRPVCLMLATPAILSPSVATAQVVDYVALGDAFGEPITTSVTGKPQRASEAPASITIITREQIERGPAASVPDLLKAYTGVDVNRWTAGQSDVTVRGGVQTYNARLLVLVDGRQVYLDHYGMTNWNLLGVELDDIQQIELVRGPVSALFGFNAASGVVNIITRAAADRRLSVTTEAGNHGYTRFSATLAMPIGETAAFKIVAGHRHERERAVPAGLSQPPAISDVNAEEANATLAIRPEEATSLELHAGIAGNRQLEFLPSQLLTEQRFRSQTAGIRANRDTQWGSLSASAYINWLQADYGTTTPNRDPFKFLANLHALNRITVVNGSALIRPDTNTTLRLGAEYRDNQLKSPSLFSDQIGYQVVAANAMIDLQPRDGFDITGAVRVDHLWLGQQGTPRQPQLDPIDAYRRTLSPISFNAAMTWQIGDHGRLRVNGGRGLQLPSLVALGMRVDVPVPELPLPFFLSGSPNLAPVNVWSGEISYSHALSMGVHLNAAIFYARTEDIIASPGSLIGAKIVTTPMTAMLLRFANVGSFTSRGLEISASGPSDSPFSWSANYTFTARDQNIPANQGQLIYAMSPKASTPLHRANLIAGYAAGNWSVGAVAHLNTATRQSSFLPSTRLITIHVPTVVTVDVRLTRSLTPTMSLYVAGDNITNAVGAYGSPIPADRRLRLGLAVRL